MILIPHILKSDKFETEFIETIISYLSNIENKNQDYLLYMFTDKNQELEIKIGKYPMSTLYEPIYGYRIKVVFNKLCYRYYLPEDDLTLEFYKYDKYNHRSFVSKKIPQYLKERIEKAVKI
ncbi:MAG: hypothetical protein CMF62_00240 [Magnetococcales bacterium]|nr:hypothetical protein [Magnetococcales bacterium]|tara:strand:+ start:22993 stop:23355 length:363 start_codon:yes stop_codon:yes gene_type:complete